MVVDFLGYIVFVGVGVVGLRDIIVMFIMFYEVGVMVYVGFME